MKTLMGYFQFNVGTTTYSFSLARRYGEHGVGFQVGDSRWRTPIPFYELFSDEYTWSSVEENEHYECDS